MDLQLPQGEPAGTCLQHTFNAGHYTFVTETCSDFQDIERVFLSVAARTQRVMHLSHFSMGGNGGVYFAATALKSMQVIIELAAVKIPHTLHIGVPSYQSLYDTRDEYLIVA